jgi:hypothetical protein
MTDPNAVRNSERPTPHRHGRSLAPLVADPSDSTLSPYPTDVAPPTNYQSVIGVLQKWGPPALVIGIPLLLMASAALSIPAAPDAPRRRPGFDFSSTSALVTETDSTRPGAPAEAEMAPEPSVSGSSVSSASYGRSEPAPRRGFSPVRDRPSAPTPPLPAPLQMIAPAPEALGISATVGSAPGNRRGPRPPVEDSSPGDRADGEAVEVAPPPVDAPEVEQRQGTEDPQADTPPNPANGDSERGDAAPAAAPPEAAPPNDAQVEP